MPFAANKWEQKDLYLNLKSFIFVLPQKFKE